MGSLNALKTLGVTIKSMEQSREELNKGKTDNQVGQPPLIDVKGGVKQIAVHKGVIPYAYKDVEFDVKHIKDNIVAQAKASKRKFKVKQFQSYIDTLTSIISKIRMGIRPDCSYIIGAPNGFGKTSFVNTSLKVMIAKEWSAVPYVSLSELAELRVETEKTLLKGVEIKSRREIEEEEAETAYYFKDPSDTIKMPKVITGRFSWSEYMNSDILFCFFTTIDSKVIESHTLKCILDIRSAKGLPTIAFISTSLDPYKADYNLRDYVWDEILAYKEDKNCFDRVYHVSCYKFTNSIIGDEELGIESV